MSKHGCHATSNHQKFHFVSSDIPVVILPIAVALSYLILILYKKTRTISHRLEVVPQPEEKEATQDLVSIHDEENLNPATAPPSKFSSMPTTALRFFHYRNTVPALLDVLGTATCSIMEISLIQIALISESSILCFWDKHRIPKNFIALATAWSVLFVREMITREATETPRIGYTLVILVLLIVALFSNPQALEKPSTRVSSSERLTGKSPSKAARIGESPPTELLPFTLEHTFSAALLLVAATKEYFSEDINFYKQRVLSFVLPLSILLLKSAKENWQVTGNIYGTTSQRMRAFAKIVVATTPGFFYHGLLFPLVFCGLYAAGFLMTSFLTSCLGFRNLIFGLPTTAPSSTDMGIVGGMLYLIVGLVCLQLKSDEMELGKSRITNMTSILADGSVDRHACGAGCCFEWY